MHTFLVLVFLVLSIFIFKLNDHSLKTNAPSLLATRDRNSCRQTAIRNIYYVRLSLFISDDCSEVYSSLHLRVLEFPRSF